MLAAGLGVIGRTAVPSGVVVQLRPHYSDEHALRPGRVTAIRGIAFQSDGHSTIGRIFIRPLEALDRWIAGILPRPGEQSLAMHAGVHVEIDGASEYIAEQLVGSFDFDFRNGLNWTPLQKFRQRDRGGWDVTVPATAFRAVDDTLVAETLANLNRIEGHPFIGEDCTAFCERAFGNRRLFADSPLLRSLGVSVRIGDPALPLLEGDAVLSEPASSLIQFDKIKYLPDALASVGSPNVRLWAHRALPILALALVLTRVTRRPRADRRPLRVPLASS